MWALLAVGDDGECFRVEILDSVGSGHGWLGNLQKKIQYRASLERIPEPDDGTRLVYPGFIKYESSHPRYEVYGSPV